MRADTNVALVYRYYDELCNSGNTTVIDELLSPTFVFYPPDAPEGLAGRTTHALYVAWERRAFPDSQFSVVDTVSDGEQVATRWLACGTHQGPYAGVAPTGRQITLQGMHLFRIAKGRIQELHSYYDLLAVRRQLRAHAMEQAVSALDETTARWREAISAAR